ncbi:inverse autotransporter beta domain-containing protein [Alphaproteobacteria bacterium]|nr:inverse autotransporter beta domain-containing protein [Alphaproteobacteria bacterium]
MQKLGGLALGVSVMLAGCSAIDRTVDYFVGSEEKAEAVGTASSKAVADAAKSDDAAASLTSTAVNAASKAVAQGSAAAIDNSIENSRTSITLTGVDKGKGRYEIKNVTGFEFGSTDTRQTFFQGGATNKDARTTLNLGVGQRYLSADEKMITGINAFFDYDFDYGHQRASIGGELKTSVFELTANNYMAISSWETGKNNNRERALDGYDIELGGQLPYLPGGKLYVKTWKWDVPNSSSDIKGKTYSLAFSEVLGNGVGLELGRKDYDGLQKDENFVKLSFSIKTGGGASLTRESFFSDKMFERSSMRKHMLDEVRRNNAIVVQTEFSAAVGGV